MITKEQIKQAADQYAEEQYGDYEACESRGMDENYRETEISFIAGATWMQEQDQWIPVIDQLPEVGEYVLVCLEGGVILKGRLYFDGWTAFFADGEKPVGTLRPVTHWKPMPKLPKPATT